MLEGMMTVKQLEALEDELYQEAHKNPNEVQMQRLIMVSTLLQAKYKEEEGIHAV